MVEMDVDKYVFTMSIPIHTILIEINLIFLPSTMLNGKKEKSVV